MYITFGTRSFEESHWNWHWMDHHNQACSAWVPQHAGIDPGQRQRHTAANEMRRWTPNGCQNLSLGATEGFPGCVLEGRARACSSVQTPVQTKCRINTFKTWGWHCFGCIVFILLCGSILAWLSWDHACIHVGTLLAQIACVAYFDLYKWQGATSRSKPWPCCTSCRQAWRLCSSSSRGLSVFCKTVPECSGRVYLDLKLDENFACIYMSWWFQMIYLAPPWSGIVAEWWEKACDIKPASCSCAWAQASTLGARYTIGVCRHLGNLICTPRLI